MKFVAYFIIIIISLQTKLGFDIEGYNKALKLKTSVAIQDLHTFNKKSLIVRFANNYILILDLNTNNFYKFSRRGDFLKKVNLENLQIKLPAKVRKKRVRIVDFWPLPNDKIVLAEGNTASLYVIDSMGKIITTIQLQNSPKSVLVLNSNRFGVIYEDFTGTHLKILSFSGRTFNKVKIDDSAVKKQPLGIKIYFSPIEYFWAKNNLVFIYLSAKRKIIKCEFIGDSISFEKFEIKESDGNLLNFGFHWKKDTFWYFTDTGTYYEIDWKTKHVVKRININISNVNNFVGFQHLNNFFVVIKNRILAYEYK